MKTSKYLLVLSPTGEGTMELLIATTSLRGACVCMGETKMAVVVYESHLHDISIPGSHYTIVVPGASNEEVAKILVDAKVGVWYDHYITKSVRVLREAGYEPVVLSGVVNVHPHDEPTIVSVDSHYPHEGESAKGMGVEVPEDDDEDELDGGMDDDLM